MPEIASNFVTVAPSAKGFGSKLDKDIGGDLTSSGKKAGRLFGSALKVGAVGVLAGVALGGALVKSTLAKASALNESQSKVGVVFGKSAAQIVKASKTADTAMGLSQNAYLGATGSLGNLLVSLDLGPKKAAGMSTQMVKLAGDLASFNNVKPEEALAALQSGLTGETEPLKRFGVNMNEATLKAQALALGILKPVKSQDKIKASLAKVTIAQAGYNEAVKKHGKSSLEALKAEARLGSAQGILKKNTEGTIPPLTAQQKALAAQSLIMKQTKTAQGDFARTGGGLANQQRKLSASFTNVQTTLGKGFLPIAVQAVTFLNATAVPVVKRLAASFTRDVAPVLVKLADTYLPRVQAQFKSAFAGVDFKSVGAGLASFDFDGLIDKATRLGTSIKGSFSGFGGSGGADVGKAFGDLKTSIAGIDTTKLKESFGKGASDTLTVFSVVVGFAANHVDTLAKYLPLLVGAFIAYKTAQAASNVVAIAALPLQVAQIGATLTHSAAMRALAAQLALLNGVERVGLLTRIRSTAATVASTVATVASTVASKTAAAASRVWAAGQWLLNAALTANPIGLIVVAVALLIGGLVLAYKHSDKFRAIVGKVGEVIKAAAGQVGAFVVMLVGKFGEAVAFVKTVPGKILGALGSLGSKLGGKARESFGAFLIAGKRGATRVIDFVKAIPGRVLGALGDLGGVLLGAGKDMIQGLIDGITAKFTALKKKLGQVTKLIPDWKGPPATDAKLLRPAGRTIIGSLVTGLGDGEPGLHSKLKGITSQIQVRAPRLEPSVSGATAAGSAGGRGGQELRGTLAIDRDGVAYIRGIARDAVQTGKAAREAALRNEATGAVSFA